MLRRQVAFSILAVRADLTASSTSSRGWWRREIFRASGSRVSDSTMMATQSALSALG
jgi:hypothetical protein